MDAEAQKSFREFVRIRSSTLLKTAVLLSGGDRHAAEDLLQNALIKAAGRWHRIDEPEAYVRQVLYRQQVSRWRLKWPRRELSVAEPPEGTFHDADASSAAELRVVMGGAGPAHRPAAHRARSALLRGSAGGRRGPPPRLLRRNRTVHHPPLARPAAHSRPRTGRTRPGRRRAAVVP